MCAYFSEMVGATAALAGGDLDARVRPRGKDDRLGNALSELFSEVSRVVAGVKDQSAA